MKFQITVVHQFVKIVSAKKLITDVCFGLDRKYTDKQNRAICLYIKSL